MADAAVGAAEPLLSAESLDKHYGGVHAVREVSLTVAPGKVLGLIGPNGAGKTTLVDLLCGDQVGDGGRITIEGRVVHGPPSRRAQLGLARTFQYPQLAPELTVFDNVLLGRLRPRMRGIGGMLRTAVSSVGRSVRTADAEAVREVCAALGIDRPRRPVSALTLGEQRLVEVARALAQRPKVLLLDEPFAGSDRSGEAGVRHAIGQVTAAGHGVLLVDHNTDIVASLADDVVLLDRGSVAFTGTPEDCLRSAAMREVYFGTAASDGDTGKAG